MTREEATNRLLQGEPFSELYDPTWDEALKMAIEALKQEPCEDCISRAEAQTGIEMNAARYTIAKERGGMGHVEWSDKLIEVSDAIDIIRNLPSVTPQESSW